MGQTFFAKDPPLVTTTSASTMRTHQLFVSEPKSAVHSEQAPLSQVKQ